MVYLRARYYNASNGRFLSRDTWGGNDKQPMSYNEWLYVYENPINGIDRAGMDPEDLCINVPTGGANESCENATRAPMVKNYNYINPPRNITWISNKYTDQIAAKGVSDLPSGVIVSRSGLNKGI